MSGRRRSVQRTVVWVVFAALWTGLDIVVPLRHLSDTEGDFRAYHQAARALLAGVSPYSEPAFIYPPLLPVAMLPLAPLPIATARLIWFAISQAALLASLWLMLRALGSGITAAAAVTLVWIVGGTVQENLVLGQVNPLLLVAIASGLWLLPRRAHAAAIAIGIASALKVWPAALLLVFAWRRQWRPLLVGVAVTGLLLAVPAAITAGLVDQADALGGERPLRVGNAAPLNVSLPALALRLADPPRGGTMPASWIGGTSPAGFEPWARHGWIAAGVAAVVLITTALAIAPLGASVGSSLHVTDRRPFADASASWSLEIGAITAAAILAAPVGWYHYQLCQFPAFAFTIERALAAGRTRAALLLLVLLGTLTRAQSWGFGRYVERWGWTGEAPAVLWMVTSVVPILSGLWTAYLVREARRATASSAVC